MTVVVAHPIAGRITWPHELVKARVFDIVFDDDQPRVVALHLGLAPGETHRRTVWWIHRGQLSAGRTGREADDVSRQIVEPEPANPTKLVRLSRLDTVAVLPQWALGVFLEEVSRHSFAADLEAFGADDLDRLAARLLNS